MGAYPYKNNFCDAFVVFICRGNSRGCPTFATTRRRSTMADVIYPYRGMVFMGLFTFVVGANIIRPERPKIQKTSQTLFL
jgi:hypothetical protein